MKLPISALSHIKDHVNMVNATTWSFYMLHSIIMIFFHSNILQDVEKECLNQLNAYLINPLDISYVLLTSFMAIVTMAKLFENRVICSHS